MRTFIRLACLLCALPCLTACAPMLSLIGTNQTVVQIMAQVERVKVAGDGASYVASSKTLTDHALSKVTGADCRIFNIVKGTVCATKTAVAGADAKAKQAANESTGQPVVLVAATENSKLPEDQAAGDD